jgi:hypothetical protein
VVFAGAVLGRTFDWNLLGRIARVGEADVLPALRAVTRVQLITSPRGGVPARQRTSRARRESVASPVTRQGSVPGDQRQVWEVAMVVVMPAQAVAVRASARELAAG